MQLATQILVFFVAATFGLLIVGTALTPGLALFFWVMNHTMGWAWWSRAWTLAVTLGMAYMLYGFCLMALTVLITRAMPRLREGAYPYFSRQAMQWYLNGVLTFIVGKTFLDFVLMSGLNVIYYRLLGAKIGKGVQINTKEIAEPHLISIGDRTMIGARVIVTAHLAERGKLILRPVKIGAGVTIGQQAMIFPGVDIGDEAVIGAMALILKDKKVPAGALFVGVPARNVKGQGPAEPDGAGEQLGKTKSAD
jgi:acetyltransferase-like isoleucine patch superfamily enzyme